MTEKSVIRYDVTIIPSLLFLVSRFCTLPKVKFDALVHQKAGKENQYRYLFSYSYQYIVEILSNK